MSKAKAHRQAPLQKELACLLHQATSTVDKAYQLSTVCRDLTEEERRVLARAEVQLLSDRVDAYKHAEEDKGTSDGNLNQKNDCLAGLVAYAKSNERAFNILTDNKTKRAYILVEDGSLQVPIEIWRVMRPMLRDLGLSDDLLNRADDFGNKAGPDAEVGPIVGTVGPTNFVRTLVKAAKSIGITNPREMAINDFSRISLIRIGASNEAPIKKFDSVSKIMLADEFFVDDPDTQIPDVPEGELDTTQKYWVPLGEEQSMIDQTVLKRYITRAGPRAKALREALAWLNTNEAKADAPIKPRVPCPKGESKTENESRHRTTVIDKKFVGGLIQKAQSLDMNRAPNTVLNEALSLKNLFTSADAIVMAPLDTFTPLERTFAHYIFFSGQVSNAVIPAEKQVMVVQNNDSWTPAFNFRAHLSNCGMAKDTIVHAAYTGMLAPISQPETVTSTSLLHVVNHTRKSQLQKVTKELLTHHLSASARHCSIGNVSEQEEVFGALPKDLPFMATGYASASTFNKHCLRAASRLGDTLGRLNAGLTTGGSSNQSMGALVNSFHAAGGKLCANISTHTLVYAENPSGRLPDSSFGVLFNDIYQRMALMTCINNHFNFLEGGFGTIQEILFARLARSLFPQLMTNKTELFYCPHLPGHTAPILAPFFAMENMESTQEALKTNNPMALYETEKRIVCQTEDQLLESQAIFIKDWEKNGRPAPFTRPLALPQNGRGTDVKTQAIAA